MHPICILTPREVCHLNVRVTQKEWMQERRMEESNRTIEKHFFQYLRPPFCKLQALLSVVVRELLFVPARSLKWRSKTAGNVVLGCARKALAIKM